MVSIMQQRDSGTKISRANNSDFLHRTLQGRTVGLRRHGRPRLWFRHVRRPCQRRDLPVSLPMHACIVPAAALAWQVTMWTESSASACHACRSHQEHQIEGKRVEAKSAVPRSGEEGGMAMARGGGAAGGSVNPTKIFIGGTVSSSSSIGSSSDRGQHKSWNNDSELG